MRKLYSDFINRGDFQVDRIDEDTLVYGYTFNNSRIAIYINFTAQFNSISLPNNTNTKVVNQLGTYSIDEQKQRLHLAGYSGAVVRIDQTLLDSEITDEATVLECNG
jgi:hypothetical protein